MKKNKIIFWVATIIIFLISHLVVDKNITYILMPVVVGIILALSYAYNQKIQNNA